MVDWLKTIRKTVTAFITAGGVTFVATFLGQFPPETTIYGPITVGGLAALWRFVSDAVKHRNDA